MSKDSSYNMFNTEALSSTCDLLILWYRGIFTVISASEIGEKNNVNNNCV
jgi:hypothetical protein